MKFLFLIAATYLIIEYLNYLRRKENKEEVDKNSFEKVVDKATDSIEKIVEETKEILSTPAKKSVVDIQSLDPVLPSPINAGSLAGEPKANDAVCEADAAIACQSKISFKPEASDNQQIIEPTVEEVQRFIDDSEVLLEQDGTDKKSSEAEEDIY